MKTPTKEVRKKPYEAQSFIAGEKKGKKEALEDVKKILSEAKCYCELCAFGEPCNEEYKLVNITEIKQRLEKLNGK